MEIKGIPLPTNYTDAEWEGLKKYNKVDNADGTISFEDVTQYINKENSFFGANDANTMNGAINEIVQDGYLSTTIKLNYAIPKESYILNPAYESDPEKYWADHYSVEIALDCTDTMIGTINPNTEHTSEIDCALLTKSDTQNGKIVLWFKDMPSGYEIESVMLKNSFIKSATQSAAERKKIEQQFAQERARIEQENRELARIVAEQKAQLEAKEKQEKAQVNARLLSVETDTNEMKPQVSFMANQDLQAMTTAYIEDDVPLPINVMVLATPQEWQPDTDYKKGDLFIYDGKHGFIKQNVKSLDIYKPFAIGTEALYGARPLAVNGVYPYVYNMALQVGMIVEHEGVKYRAIQNANELLFEPKEVPNLLEVIND